MRRLWTAVTAACLIAVISGVTTHLVYDPCLSDNSFLRWLYNCDSPAGGGGSGAGYQQ